MGEHITSGRAIRHFCQKCVNSSLTRIIKDCGGEMVMATSKPCALFKLRLKGRGNVRAIRPAKLQTRTRPEKEVGYTRV